MEKEFFDKILDQVIEEASTMYVENEKINTEEIEKEEFSDIHKQKMKKLFKEVKRTENRKKAVKLTKKVAIVVVSVLLLSGVLVTSVEAWREEVVRFIMKNNDDNYMSIDFGNSDDKEESGVESGKVEESNGFIIDDIKFMYLPEGFEFDNKYVVEKLTYYKFFNR